MNSSQYLHYPADYLHPLPTTLDVKKSPLAMLAQTCSSIGKDVVPAKANPSPDSKEVEKQPSTVETKVPTSPVAKKDSPKDEKPGFRTVPPKEIPPLVPITKEQSASPIDLKRRESPVVNSRPVSTGSKGSPTSNHSWTSKESDSRDHPGRAPSSSPIYTKPSSLPSAYCHPSIGSHSTIKPNNHPLYSGLHASQMGYQGMSLHGLSPEAIAIYQSQLLAAQSGLHAQGLAASSAAAAAAAQQSALKAGAASASMNPYVSYTRVRTPSGATTLVPVCKDPYCTNCQLTVQTSHTSATCKTPGCSQCAHEKALLGLSSGATGLGMLGNPLSHIYPHLASLPSSASGLQSLSSLHSLYPHSALPSAHQGLPYICNWVSGHDYCGKRFNSSEELMQHLRSHTSSIDSGLPAGYGFGLPPSALSANGVSAGGLVHLGMSAPMSPNSLRRAYPTSLSPGLLSSRFHPYKSQLGNIGVPPTSHLPPLSAYYPQYSSLYGPRLGAAVP